MRVVDDFERDTLQAGISLGSDAGFAVQFLDGEPTPLDIFCQVIHLQSVVVTHQLRAVHRISVDFRVQSVPLRSGEFLNRHSAQGQALQSPQIAGGVRGQFFRHGLAAFLVADLVHGPSKAGIALGRAAGLGVLLLQFEGQGARLVFHAE